MLIGRLAIAQRIPHAGDMCLLEGVVGWDATSIDCLATSHRDPCNPLRSNQRLAAVCGIEYAAQAMALHGSLASPALEKPRAGYLASVRDCVCSVERLDTILADLEIHAERIFDDGQRVIYAFQVCSLGQELLQGRAAVVLDVGSALPPPRAS